jgi:hypothetical protein
MGKNCFNDWKQETFSFAVEANLNFLRRIHRHFSIESISKPGLKTFLGMFDSFNEFIIKDKFDVASSLNMFISSVEQYSTLIKFPIAASAHNFDEFSFD